MLRIDQTCYDQLRRHGEETYPHECCGVLLGRVEDEDQRLVTSIARAGNTRTDSPQNRYNIDPRELITIQRQARETNSFLLLGGEEAEKRFQDEPLQAVAQIAETKTPA